MSLGRYRVAAAVAVSDMAVAAEFYEAKSGSRAPPRRHRATTARTPARTGR